MYKRNRNDSGRPERQKVLPVFRMSGHLWHHLLRHGDVIQKLFQAANESQQG